MQLQLTVKIIDKASTRNDFSMRVIQACATDAHVFAINAFGASGDGNHFGCGHVIIFDHHDARKNFASTVIVNACRDLGEFFQHQPKHQTTQKSHIIASMLLRFLLTFQ